MKWNLKAHTTRLPNISPEQSTFAGLWKAFGQQVTKTKFPCATLSIGEINEAPNRGKSASGPGLMDDLGRLNNSKKKTFPGRSYYHGLWIQFNYRTIWWIIYIRQCDNEAVSNTNIDTKTIEH